MDATLKRREVVRHRKDITTIRRDGRRLAGAALYLRYLPSLSPNPDNSAPTRRIAFLLGRGTRGAVRRNRLKRRLREIYRTGKDRFPVGYDYLLHATPAAADLDYAGLEHSVRKLTERLRDAVGCN